MKTILLPARSPNLNAFAERWVRSAKEECLSKLILFGEGPLVRTLAEFSAHYHGERNHQGKGNKPSAASRKNYPGPLRRIHYYDEEQQRHLKFLTNNFDLPAITICHLYKSRWQVELFFKWIQQHLRIKTFYGYTDNAVKTQVWIYPPESRETLPRIPPESSLALKRCALDADEQQG